MKKTERNIWKLLIGVFAVSFTLFLFSPPGSVVNTISMYCWLGFIFLNLIYAFITGFLRSLSKKKQSIIERKAEKNFSSYIGSMPDIFKEQEEKMLSRFESWYNQTLPLLQELQFSFQKAVIPLKRGMLISMIIFLGLTMLLLYWMLPVIEEGLSDPNISMLSSVLIPLLILTGIIALIVFGIWSIVKKKIIRKHQNNALPKYKAKIIQSMISSFSEKLNYYPEKGIEFHKFVQSDIFYTGEEKTGPNRSESDKLFDSYFSKKIGLFDITEFHSEDLITNQNGPINFSLAECSAKYIQESLDENKHKPIELFNGLFMQIKTEKSTNNFLKFGTYLKNEVCKDEFRIHTKNPVFETYFNVYGDNPEFAQRVLSPAFIEYVLQFLFYSENNNCYFHYTKNNIYIATETNENFFEVSDNFYISKTNLFRYYTILILFTRMFEITTTLHHNWYDSVQANKTQQK